MIVCQLTFMRVDEDNMSAGAHMSGATPRESALVCAFLRRYAAELERNIYSDEDIGLFTRGAVDGEKC